MNAKQLALTFKGIAIAVALISAPWLGAAQAQSLGSLQNSTDPSSKDGLPPILRRVGFSQRLGEHIPLDDTFTDEHGSPVRLREYFGKKPVVLILAYYRCPMLCSEVLSGAASVFKKLGFGIGDQFNALTVSFDPRDSSQAAADAQRTYVRLCGDSKASAGWHFLTGQKLQIDALADAVGFHYAFDPKTGQYAHAAGLVVITPDGRLAQYFYGIQFSDRDLRLAIVQSSAEKIGSMVDEILLYCCKYDANTGRYQALIGRILQVAGAFTILVVGGGLFFFFRLEATARTLKS